MICEYKIGLWFVNINYQPQYLKKSQSGKSMKKIKISFECTQMIHFKYMRISKYDCQILTQQY